MVVDTNGYHFLMGVFLMKLNVMVNVKKGVMQVWNGFNTHVQVLPLNVINLVKMLKRSTHKELNTSTSECKVTELRKNQENLNGTKGFENLKEETMLEPLNDPLWVKPYTLQIDVIEKTCMEWIGVVDDNLNELVE
jgi:hypothetical protein